MDRRPSGLSRLGIRIEHEQREVVAREDATVIVDRALVGGGVRPPHRDAPGPALGVDFEVECHALRVAVVGTETRAAAPVVATPPEHDVEPISVGHLRHAANVAQDRRGVVDELLRLIEASQRPESIDDDLLPGIGEAVRIGVLARQVERKAVGVVRRQVAFEREPPIREQSGVAVEREPTGTRASLGGGRGRGRRRRRRRRRGRRRGRRGRGHGRGRGRGHGRGRRRPPVSLSLAPRARPRRTPRKHQN